MDTDGKNDNPKSKVVAHILPQKEKEPEQLLDWLKTLPPGGTLRIRIPGKEDNEPDSDE